MSLAKNMRKLTDNARNENEGFDFVWGKTIERIKEKALEGKNEICWYDAASEVVYDQKYTQYRHMLADKLEQNGFEIKTGFALGKGMGSWDTPYIIW